MAWTERYVSASADGSGNGTTETVGGANGPWTLAQLAALSTTALQGIRVNIKAGTYANTTSTITFACTSIITAATWFRGYKTTPGDQDFNYAAVPGTDIPLFTFTGAGRLLFTCNYHIVTNIAVDGETGGATGLVSVTGSIMEFGNFRVNCTGSGAASYAINAQSTGATYAGCSFVKTTSSCQVVYIQATSRFIDCYVAGGSKSMQGTTQSGTLVACILVGSSGSGVETTSATTTAINCTFYSMGGDAITNTSGTPYHWIQNSYFESCASMVNNASGSNTRIASINNYTYACTSRLIGITESFELVPGVDLGASGLTDATNGNYMPNDLLQDAGFPKKWPELTGTATPSVGAAYVYSAAGGGVGMSRVQSGY